MKYHIVSPDTHDKEDYYIYISNFFSNNLLIVEPKINGILVNITIDNTGIHCEDDFISEKIKHYLVTDKQFSCSVEYVNPNDKSVQNKRGSEMCWLLKGTSDCEEIFNNPIDFINPSKVIPQKKMNISTLIKLLKQYDEDMTEGFVVLLDNKRYLVQSWRYRVAEHAILVLHDAIRVTSNLDAFFNYLEDTKQDYYIKFIMWNMMIDSIHKMDKNLNEYEIFKYFESEMSHQFWNKEKYYRSFGKSRG